MLKYQFIHSTRHPDYANIQSLYRHSFPPNERKDLVKLIDDDRFAKVVSFHDEAQWVGFASLLIVRSIVHIIYFCVEPKLRDKGYGSRILQTIQTAHPDQAILVDIETIHEHIDNREQRVRRKAFYLRNGYQETNIQYTWQNESYEILSAQKTITPDDFQRFWGTLYQNGFEGY
ncbi:GNAT family N-acetyltransferase [Dubosiella muris]|uniref:N-acetyltransferase n=1 Tax=Dubosiella muris TaxID=3038133 RepID=A0AC61R8A1_9FIRM|nr:GNAT family N-acetyltransferase [Dubosiella muris]TGY66449.1 N-acetyltransferase [Dubosiella muris]